MEAALDSQAVLAKLTDDGTFDKLRQKALQGLRQHVSGGNDQLLGQSHGAEGVLDEVVERLIAYRLGCVERRRS